MRWCDGAQGQARNRLARTSTCAGPSLQVGALPSGACGLGSLAGSLLYVWCGWDARGVYVCMRRES